MKKQHPVSANSEIQGAVKLCSAFVGLGVVVLERLKQIAELICDTPVRFFESVNIAIQHFIEKSLIGRILQLKRSI